MKKYIITAGCEKDFTAASKAREDARAIAEREGYIPFPFSGENTAERNPLLAVKLAFSSLGNWRRLARQAEPGSVVLLQYPHYPLKTAYLMRRMIPRIRKKKGIRFVFLVHDLNSVRGTFGKAAVYSDGHLLGQADRIICHNGSMKEYLMKQGIPEDKLVLLNIFDYLTDAAPGEHAREDGIAIAGNLEQRKSGYVGKFIRLSNGEIPVHLYGTGLELGHGEQNISYHGAVPSGELPGKIRGGFGLVWDGPSADSCLGKMGGYLRINNPHKMSLYLASGMPVIVWKEAAAAKFTEENGVGLAVESLQEVKRKIREIPEEEYREMARRAGEIGAGLRSGIRLVAALEKAEGPAPD